jgi:glucokinase
MTYFLAGDIGGTKTLLQVFVAGEARRPLLRRAYPSANYANLDDIVAEFLREAALPDIAAACFALAAPVSSRQVALTNLPWLVDADALSARFNIKIVNIINDFEAVGLSIAALETADLLPLQTGIVQAEAVRLVVGAGTGLGVAWLTYQNGRYAVHPSEGGHIDFAPTNAEQVDLLNYLQARHGHVSYERIVSGPGLQAIYDFLRDTGRGTPSAELLAAMQNNDASAVIAQFASQSEIANHALKLFVQIYGAFVGNLALASLPRGGIYIAGGIAAKIAAHMQQGEFMAAFLDKGRFQNLLATLPLSIVMQAEIGLLGASGRAQV